MRTRVLIDAAAQIAQSDVVRGRLAAELKQAKGLKEDKSVAMN